MSKKRKYPKGTKRPHFPIERVHGLCATLNILLGHKPFMQDVVYDENGSKLAVLNANSIFASNSGELTGWGLYQVSADGSCYKRYLGMEERFSSRKDLYMALQMLVQTVTAIKSKNK